MKSPVLFFNFLIAGLSGVLFFWLALQNFPYLGVSKIEYQLGQVSPVMSNLGPEVRTKLVADYQAILESPVYFDLRIMPWFKHAQVIVEYEVVGGHDLVGVGRQTGPGFSYQVQAPVATYELDDGNKKALFEFDLNNFYQEKNTYRFLIDTTQHQHQPGSELRIKELKILLLM